MRWNVETCANPGKCIRCICVNRKRGDKQSVMEGGRKGKSVSSGQGLGSAWPHSPPLAPLALPWWWGLLPDWPSLLPGASAGVERPKTKRYHTCGALPSSYHARQLEPELQIAVRLPLRLLTALYWLGPWSLITSKDDRRKIQFFHKLLPVTMQCKAQL